MYITSLHVQNLKLLRDFRLDFMRGGQPRMWTVLIGENGLCKTSILRAIGMAASGPIRANQLADVASLRDVRRPEGAVTIDANIERFYSTQSRMFVGLEVRSRESVVRGISDGALRMDDVRAANLPYWFVAGYGVSRNLPRVLSGFEKPEDPAIGRLASLFDRGGIIGTGFADLLEDVGAYARLVREALIEQQLLPQASALELRGRGGVRSAADLEQSRRFEMDVGDARVKLPATWLSQGYQSCIAWVTDMIGRWIWEAGSLTSLHEMRGLVLIDEIDLHLYPSWQVALVPTLKRIFPNVQFVVNTHSPMVLPGLEPDEIVVLGRDEEGSVVHQPNDAPPALMTGSQLYQRFFGLRELHPSELGQKMRRYGFLVGNAGRTDAEEQEMLDIQALLQEKGLDSGWTPVERAR